MCVCVCVCMCVSVCVREYRCQCIRFSAITVDPNLHISYQITEL